MLCYVVLCCVGLALQCAHLTTANQWPVRSQKQADYGRKKEFEQLRRQRRRDGDGRTIFRSKSRPAYTLSEFSAASKGAPGHKSGRVSCRRQCKRASLKMVKTTTLTCPQTCKLHLSASSQMDSASSMCLESRSTLPIGLVHQHHNHHSSRSSSRRRCCRRRLCRVKLCSAVDKFERVHLFCCCSFYLPSCSIACLFLFFLQWCAILLNPRDR